MFSWCQRVFAAATQCELAHSRPAGQPPKAPHQLPALPVSPLLTPAPFPGVQGPLYSVQPVSHTHNLEFFLPHERAAHTLSVCSPFPKHSPLSDKPHGSLVLFLFLSLSLRIIHVLFSLNITLQFFLQRFRHSFFLGGGYTNPVSAISHTVTIRSFVRKQKLLF